MADFEGLLRGALTARNASTPEEREVIYQSSRNALERLIASNRALTVEAALHEKRSLEEAITRIELEFAPPPPPPEPEPESEPEPADPLDELKTILLDDAPPEVRAQVDPEIFPPSGDLSYDPAPYTDPGLPAEPAIPARVVNEPLPTTGPEVSVHADQSPAQSSDQSSRIEPEFSAIDGPAPHESGGFAPQPIPELALDDDNLPPEFSNRRKSQRRLAWVFSILLLLGVLGWGAYLVYEGIQDGTLIALDKKPETSDPNSTFVADDPDNYITIVEPGDLSSLVTANRGEARILTDQDFEVLRIVSVRDPATPGERANPVLLRLQPGVLKQISGKSVTFEMFAKSGTGAPAQFSVQCIFPGSAGCGNKRFIIGPQPEASIFQFEMGEVPSDGERVFIAINTDITAAAAQTGRGDAIDIIYARLRPEQ